MADAEALLWHGRAPDHVGRPSVHSGLRERTGVGLRRRSARPLRLGPLDVPLLSWVSGQNVAGLHSSEFQPFLRQSLVVACSALEAYVIDKAMEYAATRVAAGEFPYEREPAASAGGVTESRHERRGSQSQPAIDAYVRATRSITADRIGHILSSIGVADWTDYVDRSRDLPKGSTARELREITERRNRITRAPGGNGRGRTSIEPEELARYLHSASSIVEAMEELLKEHRESLEARERRTR